jgi:hypothetical protein
MWKKILKIDMKEARRLGDRYASDEMEEFDLNRNMGRDNFQAYMQMQNEVKARTEKHKKIKNKIDSMKDRIDPEDYMLMGVYLEQMKKNIENDNFNKFLASLKVVSRAYPIFLRGK